MQNVTLFTFGRFQAQMLFVAFNYRFNRKYLQVYSFLPLRKGNTKRNIQKTQERRSDALSTNIKLLNFLIIQFVLHITYLQCANSSLLYDTNILSNIY